MLSKSLLAAVCLLVAGGAQAAEGVRGEYVEARSAAVYAGACHYNGEATTAGREAVIAWNFTSGTAGGVSVGGLRVVAVISGDDNLDNKGARRSVLYMDAKATPAQRAALTALLKSKAGKTLGDIAAVRSSQIGFSSEDDKLTVTAGDAATLSVSKYPCKHCLMPADTWYKPLAPTDTADVAQGVATGFSDKTLGVSWKQGGDDNVFVGTFTY